MNTKNTQQTSTKKEFSHGHYGLVLKPDSAIKLRLKKFRKSYARIQNLSLG